MVYKSHTECVVRVFKCGVRVFKCVVRVFKCVVRVFKCVVCVFRCVVRVFKWLYPMRITSHIFYFYWAHNYVIIFASTSMISVFLIQCTYRQIFKCYSILIITAPDFCFLNLVVNIIVGVMDKRDSFIRFLMSHYYVLRFSNKCICIMMGKYYITNRMSVVICGWSGALQMIK